MRRIPKNYFCLLLSVLLVGIDQLFKLFVTLFMQPFQSIVLIPYILRLTYVQNTGAAFSIFEGDIVFLIILTLIALIIAIYLIISKKINSWDYLIPVSMIIGGGIGNLLDRIFRGFVVDYLDISFQPFDGFAIFNFADCLVVVGTILLIVFLLKAEFKDRKKKEE